MKPQQQKLLSLAVLGSLFVLSSTYTSKVEARKNKKRQKPPATMKKQPAMQRVSKKNKTANNTPKNIQSMKEYKQHLESEKPVVLMIHASWCGACKVSDEPFAEAAEDNPTITFLRAEGSKEVPEITTEHEMRGFPTFVLFDAQGKKVHTFSGGGWPTSVLNGKIKQYITQ